MADKNQQKPTKTTEKAVINPQTGLTPTQEQAAMLLASGQTITAVADKLNVNRCTLYEWQRLVTFQCFFNQQATDYRNSIKNGLLGLANDAMDTIRATLHSDNESNRLKAAMWIVERVKDIKTGDTDVRTVLKKKHTSSALDWGVDETFDESGYKKELRDLGLSK